MKILGIETSCDETAAAVVEINDNNTCTLLSNIVSSSMDTHVQYGGVVPEIAARAQIESIVPVIEQALTEAFTDIIPTKTDAMQTKTHIIPTKTIVIPTEVEGSNSDETRSLDSARDDAIIKSNDDPWDQIDGIAVTYGAGLGGSLLVGVLTARSLAITKNKPLYAINHVEGHLYANFITKVGPNLKSEAQNPKQTPNTKYQIPNTAPTFPLLALIVSGGHTQLVYFKNHFDYQLLGQTQDDAIGEAFDKVAKILGLPYPGGPSIAKAAMNGDPHKYKFPKAQINSLSPGLVQLRNEMQTSSSIDLSEVQENNEKRESRTYGTVSESRKQLPQQFGKSTTGTGGSAGGLGGAINGRGYDFSFSGPKTAVLRQVQQLCSKSYDFPSFKLSGLLNEAQKADVAASFQHLAIETVVDKAVQACEEFQPKCFIVGGGVASSQELRRQLSERLPLPVEYTDPKLCTDNGAMIATLGCFKAKLHQPTANPFTLDIRPNLSM